MMQAAKSCAELASQSVHATRMVVLRMAELENSTKTWIEPNPTPRIEPSTSTTTLFAGLRPPLAPTQSRTNEDDANHSALKRKRLDVKLCSGCRRHNILSSDHRYGSKCPYHPDNVSKRIEDTRIMAMAAAHSAMERVNERVNVA